MKSLGKYLLALVLPLMVVCSQSVTEKYEKGFQTLISLQSGVKGIHQSLETFYPIAIAEDSSYYIFEYSGGRYQHVKTAKRSGNIPSKIRAAFPLQEYDNKMVCVVTGDVFDSQEDYAVIFHEFVHCYQAADCEYELKDNIGLYKKAMKEKNYMWELSYPFPYENEDVAKLYLVFVKAAHEYDGKILIETRKSLKLKLSKYDFEYMTWQEWKEGFARFIENKIRERFNVTQRKTELSFPLDRVAFYEGGSSLIKYIVKENNNQIPDLKKLYNEIIN